LPPVPFEASAALSVRVDAKARVCVRQSYYSVPARYAGARLDVALGATTVRVLDGAKVIAEHVRSLHKGSQGLVLDHYLEVLTRKPGALAGSSALATARASRTFTATHEAYWKAARARLGDSGGTRALIEALLLHRTLPTDAVLAGIEEVTTAGVFDADVIAMTARRLLHAASSPPSPPPVTVPEGAPPAALVHRPVPSLDSYDELLAAGAGA
jgi:hypothetical protein